MMVVVVVIVMVATIITSTIIITTIHTIITIDGPILKVRNHFVDHIVPLKVQIKFRIARDGSQILFIKGGTVVVIMALLIVE